MIFTKKHHETARRLYEDEGWSVAQITRKAGMPEDTKTIRRWLTELGVDIRSPSYSPRKKILRPVLKAKHHEEARRLYEDEGWSVAQISKKVGMPEDPKTIRRWLTKLGVDIRSPSDSRRYPRKKILKALKAKVPRREIVEKYGCSRKYLCLLARGTIKP